MEFKFGINGAELPHLKIKLYSTIVSLVNRNEHWRHNADNNKLNMTIFLNLKKAFDTVDHRILINKLMKYGIKGKGI